ncbi:MAG: TonB-dependent receptor [Deltaproteobacteria bacterium]|nr:TonB-dependent receptor [Deltaproteobacteria bacterium]
MKDVRYFPLFFCLLAGSALADGKGGAAGERLDKVEKESEALKDEIRKLKLDVAVPKAEYKSYGGLGPAASKVYYVPRGFSIGGYGEVTYEHFGAASKTNKADVVRFVPYLGYKFNDRIVMNAELEVEHAGIGNVGDRKPEVYVEFAYLDFLIHQAFSIRAGLILMPASSMNEFHEPTVYNGVLRPDVERLIIPSVWREIGLMLHGRFDFGLSYKLALTSGLRTDTIKDWIKDGRQRGAEINFDRFAAIARLDYSFKDIVKVGGFAYYGEGEDKAGGAENGTQIGYFALFGGEAQFDWKNIWLKGAVAFGSAAGNNAYQTEPGKNRSKEVYGGYVEAAYNLMPLFSPETVMSLSPFVRYEKYNLQSAVFNGNTADAAKDRTVLTFGLGFKPHPQVVIKADYQLRDTASTLAEGLGKDAAGNSRDGDKVDQFNVGVGFIF